MLSLNHPGKLWCHPYEIGGWVKLFNFFLILTVAALNEAAFSSSVHSTSSTSSYQTHSRLSSYLGGQLSLIVPYFVVHGIQPAEDTPNYMPRKVVDNGDVVVTPGLGLEYKDDNGFLALAAVVKDCYNNLAGTLQLGESFHITKATDWGLSFGVYARETPTTCEAHSDYPGMTSTHCHAMDNYSWKFLAHFNNESVDIIPMPFLHLTTNIYKSQSIQIDLKVMGNLILNEVGFSVLL